MTICRECGEPDSSHSSKTWRAEHKECAVTVTVSMAVLIRQPSGERMPVYCPNCSEEFSDWQPIHPAYVDDGAEARPLNLDNAVRETQESVDLLFPHPRERRDDGVVHKGLMQVLPGTFAKHRQSLDRITNDFTEKQWDMLTEREREEYHADPEAFLARCTFEDTAEGDDDLEPIDVNAPAVILSELDDPCPSCGATDVICEHTRIGRIKEKS